MERLSSFLERHHVADIPGHGKILEIPDDMDPLEAFELIVENGFLSAPVITANAFRDPKVKPMYHGFIDTRTLVSWVVSAAEEHSSRPLLSEIVRVGIKKLIAAIAGQVNLAYLAKMHPLFTVQASDSLLALAGKLSSRGCHRVAVMTSSGRIEKLVTQGILTEFLIKHKEELADVLSLTLEELRLRGTSPVVCVSKNLSTKQVFQLMDRKHLSSIAILDDDGRIIGATSGKDLKFYLKDPRPAALDEPIFSFLNIIRQSTFRESVPVLVCTRTQKLGFVLQKLLATREHRIFVIDDEKSHRPVSVLSLSDILHNCISSSTDEHKYKS